MRRATRSRTHRQCVWGLALLLSLLCGSPGQAQYTQSHGVVSAGGGFSQSDAYRNIGTLGQASPLGRSSHQLAVNYGGFWGGGVSGAAYTLTVQKGGDGQGTVTGGGINCDPDCLSQSIVCEEHTTVILNAQEAPGSTFDAWQIDGQPVTGEVTVTHDLTIAAIFTSINSPPEIISIPPSLEDRIYTYDVDAEDPDEDSLTFSLLTAPAGLVIDAQTGFIEWQPTTAQTDDHQVEVQVDDGNGGTDTQQFTLRVSAEIFGTATLQLFAGFDAETGIAACDATALVLVPGPMDITDEVVLAPGNPLDFDAAADLHFHYEPSATGALVLTLEPGVTGVLLPNRAYDTVTAGDIAGLSAWTAGQHVTSRDTVIILTADGHYFKVGNMRDDPRMWTVSLNYAELQ